MDDFFLQDPALLDPDSKLSNKKRKTRMDAAKATFKTNDNEGDSDDMDLGGVDDMNLQGSDYNSDSESDQETAAQKRLRLAKRYLNKLQDEVVEDQDGDIDAAQIDKDLISERLKKDALDASGKLFHKIAEKYANLDTQNLDVKIFKAGKKSHQLSVTGVAIAIPSEYPIISGSLRPIYLYSVSKDASIVKWDFYTGQKLDFKVGGLKPTKKIINSVGTKKLKAHVGHNDHILSIAASSDGKFIVTGGRDKVVNIWSVETNELLRSLKHHRDAISSLVFQLGTNQLYTASLDRTIKVWNVDEMSYIETLYGHQDQITCIDALRKERCITTGSRDRTVRVWKIPEESQLVFRAGGGFSTSEELVVMDGIPKKKTEKDQGLSGGSVDVVAFVDDETFVTGSDSGAISLWNCTRKKPLFTKFRAHGTEDKTEECKWISSISVVPFSDMFATGSCDGFLKLWKISESKRSFSLLSSIPILGFINSIQFFEAPDVTCNNINHQETQNEKDLTRTQMAILKDQMKEKEMSRKSLLYIAVALGQEHRLGRWWRVKEAKNEIRIIKLG